MKLVLVGGGGADRPGHQDLVGGSSLHQPGCSVGGQPKHTVCAAIDTPVGSGEHPALADPNGDIVDKAQLRRRPQQIFGGSQRPDDVILVSQRHAKGGIEVGPLVSDDQRHQERLVACQYRLHPLDVPVELGFGLVVEVVIDATELSEQRHRPPHLGNQLALSGFESLVNGGNQPVAGGFPRNGQQRPWPGGGSEILR